MDSSLHVVLGAGQIGTRLVTLLLAAGHRVRIVQRSTPRALPPGVELVRGDITDLAFAARASAGAAVVYDCMNPPYEKWAEQLLPIGRGALHGAKTAGARLVALDGLYQHGAPPEPISETTPMSPCSKKGELKRQLADLRLEARGELPLTIARASDFFGPDLARSWWGPRYFDRISAGRAGECCGDPDMPHAYTYADDVARALFTLGARDEAVGRVWIVPTLPALSSRVLGERLGAALGVDAKMKRIPRWMLRTIGLFVPTMAEVVEMTYQWEVPFRVDDSCFVSTFGWSATPLEQQIAEVAAWAAARTPRRG